MSDLIGTLLELDRAEYPGRGDRLDPALVVRAGRRRRALRRGAAAGAVGAAVVLGLAFGLPAALRSTHPTPPADRPAGAQTPYTVGDGRTAVLEEGVEAVNVPLSLSPTAVRADDLAGFDVTVTRDGDVVAVTAHNPGTGIGVSIVLPLAEPSPDRRYALGEAEDSGATLLVGLLPSWQRDPDAYLYSTVGWSLGDDANGPEAPAALLPTFHPPSVDDRLMYVVVLTGEARARITSGLHTVVSVGADGDAFWPACDRETSVAGTVPGSCSELLGAPESELDLGSHAAFQPAPAVDTREARPIGGGVTTTIARDVVALNRPEVRTPVHRLAADGVMGWDLAILPLTYTEAGWSGVGVRATSSPGSDVGVDIPWKTEDDVSDYANPGYLPVTSLPGGETSSLHTVLAGALPSWQRDPVAVFVSATGWTDENGVVRHAARLPSFHAPTADARLMFAVSVTGEAARPLWDGTQPTVVFVDADGGTVIPSCGGISVDECGAARELPLSEWLAEAGMPASTS